MVAWWLWLTSAAPHVCCHHWGLRGVLDHVTSGLPAHLLPVSSSLVQSGVAWSSPLPCWNCQEQHGSYCIACIAISSSLCSSAKCKPVWKTHTTLPDNPVALTSASKYFQVLPGPPAAVQCALKLCKRILKCSWKRLQLRRCIQDATRFHR